MREVVFDGFRILHAVFLILVAIGFFAFWVRTRFWLPKYAHLLAAIGGAVGLWCLANTPDDVPISKQSPIAKLLFVLVLSAIVYFFFVLHGGQRAAYERHFGTSVPCPYCKLPVPARRNRNSTPDGKLSYTKRKCRHCGQTFASQRVPADR